MNIKYVINNVNIFLNEHNITQASLARAIGVNPSAISTFIKGEYKGDNETLAKKLELYMNNFVSKQDHKENLAIFDSNDKKMAGFVINEAYRERQIALITGAAGSGKSTIVKDYTAGYPNTILIETTLHTTAKVLLEILGDKLGISHTKGLHDMIVAISVELRKRDVTILIDEAEHLPLRTLEDLRRIWDFSQFPIVLVGTEILLKNLMGKNGELRQLYSRIDGKWHLRGLDKSESSAYYGNVGDAIFEYTRGNFRSASKLYRKAQRLCELHNANMSKEIVQQAGSMIIV